MSFDPRLWHINQDLAPVDMSTFTPRYTPITRKEHKTRKQAARAMRFLVRQARLTRPTRPTSISFKYGPGYGVVHMWPGRIPE